VARLAAIVRAHQHAAGARRKKKIGVARSAREQGLGRSRGGLTTKVILTTADEDTAIAVDVVPGQANDAPLLEPMLDRTLGRVPVVDELVGDKAFDGDPQPLACVERDVATVIPSGANRVDPWPLDEVAYRGRNRVERLFSKVKQFRRFATRYEKLRSMFLGVVHLTLGFIRLRRLVNHRASEPDLSTSNWLTGAPPETTSACRTGARKARAQR
jgi:transposase